MSLLPSLICEENENYSVGPSVGVRGHGWLPAVLLLAGMGVLISGCSSSLDKHKYESTIYHPTTVGLLDTVTDELIWKMDVPVEQVLELDLNRSNELELFQVNADMPATDMSWLLRDRWTKKRVTSGKFELPAPHGVMITVHYRPAPEEPLVSPDAVVPETSDTAKKAMRDEVLPVEPVDVISVEAFPPAPPADADALSVDDGMNVEPTPESSQAQEEMDLAVEQMINESPAVESADGVDPLADPSGPTADVLMQDDPAQVNPAMESDPLLDALDMGSGK